MNIHAIYVKYVESFFMKKKWKKPKIKHNKLTKWNWMVGHPEGLILGNNVDIGAFTYINAKYKVYIGNNVQIGSHCSIYSHDTERNIKGSIFIHNGVKIGAHSIILPQPGRVFHIVKNIKAGSIIY